MKWDVDRVIRAGKNVGTFKAKTIDKGLVRIKNVLQSLETDRSYVKAGVTGKKGRAARPAPPKNAVDEHLAKAAKLGSVSAKHAIAARKEKRDGGSRINNVDLAIVHEFGAPSRGIPERSFIRAPFAAHRAEYISLLGALVKASVYNGKMPYVKALRIMGLKMAADMRRYVTTGTGVPPPNSPATMRRKIEKAYWKMAKRAARAKAGKPVMHGPLESPRALVDTGRMVGSITWGVVVRSTEDFPDEGKAGK